MGSRAESRLLSFRTEADWPETPVDAKSRDRPCQQNEKQPASSLTWSFLVLKIEI
jgi:hypothetical protein